MCDIALLMFILLVFTGVSALLAFKEVRRLSLELDKKQYHCKVLAEAHGKMFRSKLCPVCGPRFISAEDI